MKALNLVMISFVLMTAGCAVKDRKEMEPVRLFSDDELSPTRSDPRFDPLMRAFERYYESKDDGGPQLSESSPAVLILSRLAQIEWLDNGITIASGDVDTLRNGIMWFQWSRGLKVTGTLNQETLNALNAPLETWRKAIERNIFRRQERPYEFEETYLEVNIPDFSLTIYENGQPRWTTRVIVGKPHQKTPVLRSEIERIELNPFWEVPYSIAAHEILPKLKKDPKYLQKNHMELFTISQEKLSPSSIDWSRVDGKNFKYHIHQVPGPWNSVGAIKFIFKSNYGVYLHGTPSVELFDLAVRGLSHGCVRVQDPLSLAVYIMSGSEWNEEKIKAQLATGKTLALKVPLRIPLYLNYWTTFVDEKNLLNFRGDIYKLDG